MRRLMLSHELGVSRGGRAGASDRRRGLWICGQWLRKKPRSHRAVCVDNKRPLSTQTALCPQLHSLQSIILKKSKSKKNHHTRGGGEGKRWWQIHYRFLLSNLSPARGREALKDVCNDMALARDAAAPQRTPRRGLKPPPTKASGHPRLNLPVSEPTPPILEVVCSRFRASSQNFLARAFITSPSSSAVFNSHVAKIPAADLPCAPWFVSRFCGRRNTLNGVQKLFA